MYSSSRLLSLILKYCLVQYYYVILQFSNFNRSYSVVVRSCNSGVNAVVKQAIVLKAGRTGTNWLEPLQDAGHKLIYNLG